jgi:lipoprotein-anchoring transpeptidase ErfK/SrfK
VPPEVAKIGQSLGAQLGENMARFRSRVPLALPGSEATPAPKPLTKATGPSASREFAREASANPTEPSEEAGAISLATPAVTGGCQIPTELLRHQAGPGSLTRDSYQAAPRRSKEIKELIKECQDIRLSELAKRQALQLPLRQTRFVINKSGAFLAILAGDVPLKVYPVAFGPYPIGPKQEQGDSHTPEGEYYAVSHHPSPNYGSCFYLAYPNEKDAQDAFRAGQLGKEEFNRIKKALSQGAIPPNSTNLGGDILIHGTKDRSESSLTYTNWTLGCIALENRDVQELLDAVPTKSRIAVEIIPF